jgi:hypothetical protein
MTTYAPQNPYPESMRNVFEMKQAPSIPGGRGPLRFEEGVATDTDVPNDFQQGAYSDTAPASPRLAVPSTDSVRKWPEQTMRERAHVGSASWIEAPEVLGDFVQGSMSGDGQPSFEYAYNSGLHQNRPNAVRVDG